MLENRASVSEGVPLGNDRQGGLAPPHNASTGRGFSLRSAFCRRCPTHRTGGRRARKGFAKMANTILVQRILRRDAYRCSYCGIDLLATLDTFLSAVVDHVTPRSRGGPDHHSNMATACFACDRIKSGRPAESIDDARAIVFRQRILAMPKYVATVSLLRREVTA